MAGLAATLRDDALHFQLAQRHELGIPPARLTPHDPLLAEWWHNFLNYPPPGLPTAVRLAEISLATPLAGERLFAKFDLLALDPGERAVIVDWKTTRRRTTRKVLAKRLQTRVYPFVLAEAGEHLFGSPIAPEQASMV